MHTARGTRRFYGGKGNLFSPKMNYYAQLAPGGFLAEISP